VVILVMAIILLALLLLLVGPLVFNQLSDFIQRLPATIQSLQKLLSSFLDSEWAGYLGLESASVTDAFSKFFSGGTTIVSALVPSLWTGGLAVLNILSLFLVTPFVAFYLLRDWDKMIARLDALLPRDHADEIRMLAGRIDHKVAAFVRGQMLSGLILGTFYAAGLFVVGLNYSLLIGFIAGLISFIPYAGFAVGFVLSIGVALVQFWPNWLWILAVVGVFLAGQMLEGYVLQPRLLGSMVGLHPVWLLFGLFAFGLLFGFVGLLIAVPAAAAVGVLLHHAIDIYRASPVFRGPEPPALP
jgi:predicted PurR-regulated permease PerM